MDIGRRLTIQQKGRLLRSLILFGIFLILDFALWFFLGRQKIFLLIGCALVLIMVLAAGYLRAYYGLLSIFERNGRRLTYQVRRNLNVIFWSAFLLSVIFAEYWLYRKVPELNELLCQMTKSIPNPGIGLNLNFSDWNISLPDIHISFWHIVFAIACVGVIIMSFCCSLRQGIIAVPVMAAYGILFLRTCSGYYPADINEYLRLLGQALVILLISGLVLWNLNGVGLLLGLLRFLVPFTLISMIAIYLKDVEPVSAPPLNFRAILFWGLALSFFVAQSWQLLGGDLPEFGRPVEDNPVADQSGDEYEVSSWW